MENKIFNEKPLSHNPSSSDIKKEIETLIFDLREFEKNEKLKMDKNEDLTEARITEARSIKTSFLIIIEIFEQLSIEYIKDQQKKLIEARIRFNEILNNPDSRGYQEIFNENVA